MRDIHNNIGEAVAQDIAAITTNTTTVGNIIDLQGYEGCEFMLATGAWTDGTYTATIEVGDDAALADAATAASTEILGSYPALGAANAIGRVGLITGKRYARLSTVSTGVTTGATVGGVVVLGRPHRAPVA